LASFLETTGRRGTITPGPHPGIHRVRLAIAGRPKISILIPTAYRRGLFHGQSDTFLSRCLASIRSRTTYPNYELLLFDNGEVPAELLPELVRWGVILRPYDQPFNWARTMNRAAALATGMHLVFLDDDTEVITPDWLECLLEYSQQSEIGAVGARLEFPDGRIQHTGVTILEGVPGHPFYGAEGNHPGHFLSTVVPRNYSAVTSACLMTRAEVFHAVGGLHENFACNFNDIDYCLRVRRAGHRVVCTPYARLYHHETATKLEFSTSELSAFKSRWQADWPRDPYHNPNLSTRYNDFRIEPDSGFPIV
jgi:GT2 family glycosyltransferase